MSTADELKKLKELLDEGVLSQEEFDTEKKKLLVNKEELKNKPTEFYKTVDRLPKNLPIKDRSNERTKEPGVGKKKTSYIKLILGFCILLALILFIFGSLPEPSNSSASNSSASNSSASSNSVCTNWANSTRSNASEFGRILGHSTTVLQNALEGKATYAEAINTINSDVKKLKTIESRQKNLTPNSDNEYSHKMFLLGVDSMIKGLEYSATGLETEYVPTLESGIELITMGTDTVSKATDSINSC